MNNELIYVPDLTNYKCFVVQNEDVIRAYEEMPTNNKNVNYRDYYINSDYIYKDGTQQFSTYTTLPVCLHTSILTNEVYYRVDFYKILIILLILSIFCFLLPIKLFLRLFRRFK